MAGSSVQEAHDALMASQPAGTSHPADCRLCHSGTGATEQAKEDAPMGDEPKFSEAQVAAMSASAVREATAQLQSKVEELTSQKAALETEKASIADQLASNEAEKAELLNTVEVAQSEKAAAESARDAVQGEFDTFRTTLTEMAAVDERKIDRIERIKAAAPHLTDEFLGDEKRQTRWAEMADEQFESLLEGYLESAAAALTPAERETVETAADKPAAITAILANRRGDITAKDVRETAAFTGHSDGPTSKGGTSSLGQLWQKTGKLPVSQPA